MNASLACAFRGPGNTEGAWAIEQMIDLLADRIGKDSLAVRDRLDPDAVHTEHRLIASEPFGWDDRRPTGEASAPASTTTKTLYGVSASATPTDRALCSSTAPRRYVCSRTARSKC